MGDHATMLTEMWTWLIAAAIATARPLGLLAMTPVFIRGQVAGLVRGGVAIALALPAVPLLASRFTHVPEPLDLLLLAFKEGVIGAVLGFLLGMPFWGFQLAGDLLDQQRGATAGRLNDPAAFEDVSVTGNLLAVTGATLFVASGGLQTLASLLYASWAIWLPLAPLPAFTPQAPRLILFVLDALLRQGLLLAAPLILAMLVTDAGLSLIARFAPQLRAEDVAQAARNLVFCIGLPVYCGALLAVMDREQVIPPGFLTQLRQVFQ